MRGIKPLPGPRLSLGHQACPAERACKEKPLRRDRRAEFWICQDRSKQCKTFKKRTLSKDGLSWSFVAHRLPAFVCVSCRLIYSPSGSCNLSCRHHVKNCVSCAPTYHELSASAIYTINHGSSVFFVLPNSPKQSPPLTKFPIK